MQSDSSFDEAVASLRAVGYSRLSPAQFASTLSVETGALQKLSGSWESLPSDEYLRDGGHYRSRRHGCFVQEFEPPSVTLVPHRAHWQPTTYNALHGGIERWFEPIHGSVTSAAAWRTVLASLGTLFARVSRVDRWFIEAHQFRIDTANGIGRPTPEGAHRDGVDFVAVILVNRRHVRGGETRVFDAQGTSGQRFTMQEPWSALLMDDARVIHETTPIQPDGGTGVRDTLVVTYRRGAFQQPDPS